MKSLSKAEKILVVNRITDLYKTGMSQQEIATQLGINSKTVSYYIKKANIIKRSTNQTKLHKKQLIEQDLDITSILDYLDGLVVSDGSLCRTGLGSVYRQSCINLDWLEEIQTVLASAGIKSSIGIDKRSKYKNGTCWVLRTDNYLILNNVYDKWYCNGIKIVPTDITVSCDFLRNWVMGDGNVYGSGLRLCCESFTKEDNERLISELHKMNFTARLGKDNRIIFNQKNTQDMLIFCIKNRRPTHSFEYKWQNKRGNRCYL